MTYFRGFTIKECRNIKSLHLDLSPGTDENRDFLHLILTGPNGSGKSGILAALCELISRDLSVRPISVSEPPFPGVSTFKLPPPALEWTPPGVYDAHREGRWIGLFMDAFRRLTVSPVEGPRKIQRASVSAAGLREGLSDSFLQYMVNAKMDEALAGNDGNQETVARIRQWFDIFRGYVGFVVGEPNIRMDFDRPNFNFVFTRGDGHQFDLRQLSDGASSFLSILAELLLRIDEIRSKLKEPDYDPPGIVLIDEIEAHLHLRLQEGVLPFLTRLFPKIQFIVATHSPAVIASIPGAVVHDLGSGVTERSEEFRGKTYGTVMVAHFGISSDIDLDTTEKLARFRALAARELRSPEEERERARLREIISQRSEALAVDLWLAEGSPAPQPPPSTAPEEPEVDR